MWTRKEVKTQGKEAFKKNYWWCVLIAVIFAFLTGGFSNSSSSADTTTDDQTTEEFVMENINEDAGIDASLSEILGEEYVDEVMDYSINVGPFSYDLSDFSGYVPGYIGTLLRLITVKMFMGFFAFAIVGSILLSIFVINPLVQGCRRFMLNNQFEKADFGSSMSEGFSPYGKVVSTLFWRDLYQVLWTLLFIIPGLVKAYSYRMVPYILAEHPEMSASEIITESRKMMDGNKWKAFVLDLSFIGWYILDAITFHIAGIFYVNPYVMSTDAALYTRLRGDSPSAPVCDNWE
ncbi:MAG: DUF975 family protein [Eubacterium sp.]|nr:DUF975 family protein [Eubacterium sp.]